MTVKKLKDIINQIPAKDDSREVIFRGRKTTDFWWIDTADGYVCGFDEEVESDGFITREEDLMKSERTAKPITKCGFPKCESCDKYVDGYCTVPMVITKQIYIEIAERIALLEETVTALENIVYDEILGDDGDFVFDCDLDGEGIGDHIVPIAVAYHVPSRREDK